MSAIREACLGDSAEMTRRSDKGSVSDLNHVTVKMRHLMASTRDSAARPGVTADMIAGYERFAAGL